MVGKLQMIIKVVFITNQLITNEQSSDGQYSFKNGHQTEYAPQWFSIFGGSKTFKVPYTNNQFSISFDAFVTQRMGADFEFTLFGINEDQDFIPVAGVGLENRGELYVIKNENYGFDYAVAARNWTTNTWHNIKITINTEEIKYYLNSILVHTIPNYSDLDIKGLTILHNNYGGNTYFDNIKINNTELNTSTLEQRNLSIFPNPVQDYLFIDTKEQIKNIEIINTLGQIVYSDRTIRQVDTQSINSGLYIAKITMNNGNVITRKFIKK